MTLPVILLPVGVDDTALDACLAALETTTPAGTPVWLADDAQGGPRVQAVVEHWLVHTRLLSVLVLCAIGLLLLASLLASAFLTALDVWL